MVLYFFYKYATQDEIDGKKSAIGPGEKGRITLHETALVAAGVGCQG